MTGIVLEHRRRAADGGVHAEFFVRYALRGTKREVSVGSADGLPYQMPEGTARHSRLEAVIQKRHSRYPVGGEIPLRVDPERPDVAHVRDREMPMAVIGVIVAVAFLMVLGMAIRIAF